MKDEDSDEKYVEIYRSSESLLEKKLKVFKLTLFSTNVLEDLVRKSNFTGTPAETMEICSDMHRSFCNPFVPHDLSLQKKGLSFEPIISADSFSLITTKKAM